MTSVAEAESIITAAVSALPTETVSIVDAANRILRETLVADRDVPPFDRVAMDGIAFACGTSVPTTLHIEGAQAAGEPPAALADPSGGCLRVMTGAILPTGCDTVVPIEQIAVEGDTAAIQTEVKPGSHVHGRGTGCVAGTVLLQPGVRLNGPQVGLIASTGKATVKVSRQPSITVFSNGNELIDVGLPIEAHQIRPSNTYALAAALVRNGYARPKRVHLPDTQEVIRRDVEAALAEDDAIILTGGVSVGAFDFVPRALDEAGVQRRFHKVEQRPGKPMWFGTHPDGCAVFALPGNPISALVCLIRYVMPYLERCSQSVPPPPEPVTLAEDIAFEKPLTFFRPVEMVSNGGKREARPAAYVGSGDLHVLAVSHGVVELDAGESRWPAGADVPFHPWP